MGGGNHIWRGMLGTVVALYTAEPLSYAIPTLIFSTTTMAQRLLSMHGLADKSINLWIMVAMPLDPSPLKVTASSERCKPFHFNIQSLQVIKLKSQHLSITCKAT